MVSVGSKALPTGSHKALSLVEASLADMEDTSYRQGQRQKGMHRKDRKKAASFGTGHAEKASYKNKFDKNSKGQNLSKNQSDSAPEFVIHRQQVDPETSKYFFEISNVLEGSGGELEEYQSICNNALEETSGKELELATDKSISHILQSLLEGCDAEHLCAFLERCVNDFVAIAMDRSGSHVAEAALKSLAMHLHDEVACSAIEETLTTICKVVVDSPVDMMFSCHGSHVLRTLLCLCKGVPLESTGLDSRKSSNRLAERLNLKAPQVNQKEIVPQHGFPDLLKFLVSKMLEHARKEIRNLQVHQYGSLVLQTALKLFAGCDEELLHIIPLVLGCNNHSLADGNFLESAVVGDMIYSMENTAFSHLMEVILEVAPKIIFDELFRKLFRNSCFEMSSHSCGNFIVQALIAHSNQDQVQLIWEELGTKFRDLLRMGRFGVIASLIAACQRLDVNDDKCNQALASAVCSENESSKCILPRILFLDSYVGCKDPSVWSWPSGSRIHLMGSLILQAVFKSPRVCIHSYITSMTSLEPDHVLEVAKDASGAPVIEAFLESNASEKQKRKLVQRLRGHFSELAMHLSSSFTVSKCFTASNMSLREAIVSELLTVRNELARTKQGYHLLRTLDVERFAARPEEWRSMQKSKESVFRKYHAVFGSNDSKPFGSGKFDADNSERALQQQKLKKMRTEIDQSLTSASQHMGSKSAVSQEVSQMKAQSSGHKRRHEGEERSSKKTHKSKATH